MKRSLPFVVALLVAVGFVAMPASAEPDAKGATDAPKPTATVIGRVVMPKKIPEGINAEGLSLDNAIILMEGKYNHPRRPYPANWREITTDERVAWTEAFDKSDEGADFARRVEEAIAGRPRFSAEIAKDGSFRFEQIPLSWYQLSVRIMHPGAGGKSSEQLARAHTMTQFFVKKTDAPQSVGTMTMKLKNVLMPGDTAPDWTAKAYDGSEIKLSDYRGKYVLFDFWATWCGPCKAEVPNLEAVYAKYGRDRFEVIGLSLDQSIDLPKAYLKKNPSPYTHGYLGSWGETETTARDYGVTYIPSIWLIGPDGKIIARDLLGKSLHEAVSKALEGEAEAKAKAKAKTE